MPDLNDDPTAYATDASIIVRVLRMADTGQWDLPDWLMPGLQFAAWHGYLRQGDPPTLSDAGRAMLAKLGPVTQPRR